MSESTQQVDREKVLSRIHKCMKLSKSSEPHEAAAALRQAQKMIQAHSVSDEELLGLEVKSVLVITPAPAMKKCPMGFARLVSIVSTAFGVDVVQEYAYVKGKPRLAFRYWGVGGRPELAAYAHDVMWRQLWSSWHAFLKLNPHLNNIRGARMGYWLGWLEQVRAKIQEFARPNEERDLIQRSQQLHYGGALSEGKNNKMAVLGSAVAAGRDAAGDFSIHRPMNGGSGQRLLS